jgi:matrixin
MDLRRVGRILGIVVTIVVVAIVWDLFSDATTAPPVATPQPAPDTEPRHSPTTSQAGRVQPAYRIPDDAEVAQPSYIAQLARAEARRQIRESGRYAYLSDILAKSSDSILHRWDNRIASPVKVHLTPGDVANYQPAFLDAVRGAFRRWQDTGLPIRFNLGGDSAGADVRLQWRLQFDIDRTGQTDLTWDADGHHKSGVITLATLNQVGQPMTVEEIRIVAMHEVGHLLGLDHSPDSADLMYPVARVRDLSARDIHSARLLYKLTPGSIR